MSISGKQDGATFFASIANHITLARWIPALVALLIATYPMPLLAALEFWTGGSTATSNWSDSSNWFPNVPMNGDDVVYGLDSNTTNFDDFSVNISTLTFSATVVPFTIHVDAGISLSISGSGVFNNSSNTQTLINDATGAGAAGGTFGGHTIFQNSSAAGNLAISNSGSNGLASSAGATFFQDSSSAGASTITNTHGTSAGQNGATIFQGKATAGMATVNNNGLTFFVDSSTGGNATINNSMGGTDFDNSSNAGSAIITNTGQTTSNSPVSPGRTDFHDTASAGSAAITNNGGTASSTLGGTIRFNASSTAASATITNNASTVSFGGGGETDFNDSSTGGSATIINNGGATQFASGGQTIFTDTSTAGSATITNNGATSGNTRGSTTEFFGTSTAANATLIANGGSGGGNGGSIEIFGDSSGGTSRIEVFGNGNLDISLHNTPGITVGSIEGDGSAFFGANNLMVGSNNLSTTFAGQIQDGGPFSTAIGGSFTKIGTGTLTLSGTNTYTGATAVNGGKLVVDGSIASSSGVAVASGATLAGHGNVSAIGGAGTIAPGNSPGILTTTHVDPSGGMSFLFDFTQSGSPTYSNAAASGNSVLHLTDATPFTMALTSANKITVDFSGASLAAGELFRGGFFTDTPTATSMVSGANFLYTGTGGFTVTFDGFVTEPMAAFASGTVLNGTVLQFDISGTGTSVPDHGNSVLLFSLGLAGLAVFHRALGLQNAKAGVDGRQSLP